ncbi:MULTISPECIES: VOC family protein [Actinoalloteichus]|uniref:Glyoxalase-like domain n=1 Tax=Actinoalloteichus fjordicus TaxID=1612552 RepID=A0AAC9LJ41_9PSEU|nr:MULTISPECIES: VOC family protein [Actinoalloteichus]APU17775.1 Glyoxalase-like domain [Actinoalloteichus fjordicus]APU23853.1 Glyoxalase-like domain [Actinoalloteichus sp. GBA129-24]
MAGPDVTAFISYAHVRDLGCSIDFYQTVGLPLAESVERAGRTVWALLGTGAARLMLAQADERVDHRRQGVLFYLYVTGAAELHRRLVDAGLDPAPITYPEHMPAGEFRLADPDGYVLLLGDPTAADQN